MPDRATRLEIFDIHTRGKPIGDDMDLTQLAEATEGYVGADIEFICRRASLLAIRDFVQAEAGKENSDYSKLRIRMKHFQKAMEMARESYKQYESQT